MEVVHLSSDEHAEGIYQSLRKLSNLAKVTQLKNNWAHTSSMKVQLLQAFSLLPPKLQVL